MSILLCGLGAFGCHFGTLRDVGHPSHRAAVEVEARPYERVEPKRVSADWERWALPIGHHHGVMLGMRLTEVYLWPEPFAETQPTQLGLRYRAAFTSSPKWDGAAPWFEWDGDRWWINAVGHSLFGSELYVAARRCSFDPLQALAMTALSSAAWEYGYEASGVRPSALDLVYTPLSGMVLGEARFWVYHRAGRLPRGPLRAILEGLVDPLGQVERGLGSPC